MPNLSHTNYPELFPVLFKSRWVATNLGRDIASVDIERLCQEYRSLRECAPSRHERRKKYFVGHEGIPSTTGGTNRREEHCAIAMCNLNRRWEHPGGGDFRFLDYQFPLKARRSDKGIGKVDLVGVNDQGRFILAELKVEGSSGGRGDAPPLALLEGMRYAAIVEANMGAIADEAKARFNVELQCTPPIVQILATEEWWRGWMVCAAAGQWQRELSALVDGLRKKTGISVDCLALDNLDFAYGGDGGKPRFGSIPNLRAVELSGEAKTGSIWGAIAKFFGQG